MKEETLIGQIIFSAQWIDTKQLSTAVNYAVSKDLPIGHVLKLLKYISEDELTDALLVQKMVRDGLDQKAGIQLLQKCRREKLRVKEAFEQEFLKGKAPKKTITPESPKQPPEQKSEAQAPDGCRLGNAFLREGKWTEAEAAYKRNLDDCKEKHGSSSVQFCAALASLAEFYTAGDRLQEAEQLYLQMLEIRQQRLGSDSPFVDQTLEDLADIYWIGNDRERSLHFYRMAVDNRARRLPQELDRFLVLLRKIHPYFLESQGKKSKRKTGEIMLAMGLLDEQSITEAVKSARSKDVPIGAELASMGRLDKVQLTAVLNMQSLVKQNRISEYIAENCLKAALQLGRSFEQFIQQTDLINSGTNDSNDWLRLLQFQEKLVSLEQELGAKHPAVADAAVELADLHRNCGQEINAELLYKRALAIRSTAGPESELKSVYECSQKLAQLYLDLKKWIDAESLLLQCLSFNQKLQKSANDDFRFLIAIAQVKHGQADEMACASMLKSAISILDKVNPMNLVVLAAEDLASMSRILRSLSMEIENQKLIHSQIQARKEKNLPVEQVLLLLD